jgi:hypothetical protein
MRLFYLPVLNPGQTRVFYLQVLNLGQTKAFYLLLLYYLGPVGLPRKSDVKGRISMKLKPVIAWMKHLICRHPQQSV